MASLAVTQPTGEGISLKFVHTPSGGINAATGTVYLATTAIDDNEFIYKDFVYTNNEATVVLTTAELVRVYTQAKVTAGTYTATVTMSATAVKADGTVLATSTAIGGAAAGAGVLTFQAVPTAPTVTSLSAQDGYIQIAFTTTSVGALTLSDNKAVCDIIVNSAEAGIQNFAGLVATVTTSDGSTRTVTVATGADSLVNGRSYEAAVRTSNANGNALFSNTESIIPNNLPNALAGVAVNTAYSSGTTLDATNAATMTATWHDADATTGDSVLVRFGVVSAGEFNANAAIQQATLAIATPANFTDAATAVGNLSIPHAWYAAAQSGVAINSGSAVTELAIVARIEQTTGGVITSSALTAASTVYKITLPTISTITIVSVDGAGLQTFNTASGGTGVDSGIGGAATMSATYLNMDATNIPITIANNLTATMDADFTMTYAVVDAGSNGTLTFTLSLPDANGTQQDGSLVSYTASSTQALHAFKDPADPTVTITKAAVTVAPTIQVSVDGANNGWTLDDYSVVVSDTANSNYKTYIADLAVGHAATTATGSTGLGSSSYIVAYYNAVFTKNLSGIPTDYSGKYTTPTITGTAVSAVLYFINPTISEVTIAGVNMVIKGNSGGSEFDANAVTSVGFVAGGTDFNISSIAADMNYEHGNARPLASDWAYIVTIGHGSNLLADKDGGNFDGLAFVNSNNANSALSIIN